MDEPESARGEDAPCAKRKWGKFFLFVVLPLLLFAGLVKYATLRAGATERAMHEAVRSRNLSQARRLLSIRPALVNAKEVADTTFDLISGSAGPMSLEMRPKNRCVLFTAVENEDADMVALLISKGADVSATDSGGCSVFSAAISNICEKGQGGASRSGIAWNKKSLEVLLQYGADPNVRDRVGMTPLMSAAYNGPADLVEFLLARGADPNMKDTGGRTALSWANNSFYKSDEVVKLLVAHGAK